MKRPFYDGLTFHRVVPDFMIQGGDPEGKGGGGPGYEFEDEVSSGLRFDQAGRLTMARKAARNTNGSQFFITDKAGLGFMDGQYSIFGQCSDLDVVHAIARVSRGAADRPDTPVVIEKVVIEQR